MFSPISCLFQDRGFSLEFRLLRTAHKPMKEGAVCIILWFSTKEYENWKLILKVNFQSILSGLLTSKR